MSWNAISTLFNNNNKEEREEEQQYWKKTKKKWREIWIYLNLNKSIESDVLCFEAYFVISKEVPSSGMVAIPAESYPRLRKIVKPSIKYSLASSEPTTPTKKREKKREWDWERKIECVWERGREWERKKDRVCVREEEIES